MIDLTISSAPTKSDLPTGHQHLDNVERSISLLRGYVSVFEEWGKSWASTLSAGGRLLAAGNGGSAAEAQHLTAELVGRYRDNRRPFSAIALHADTSSVTAISNDFGADSMFARSVEAHGKPGDILVLLSTSGKSPNLLAAASTARVSGLRTFAMTGPAPNPLAELCDEVVALGAPTSATVQELQLIALHMVCAVFDVAIAEQT